MTRTVTIAVATVPGTIRGTLHMAGWLSGSHASASSGVCFLCKSGVPSGTANPARLQDCRPRGDLPPRLPPAGAQTQIAGLGAKSAPSNATEAGGGGGPSFLYSAPPRGRAPASRVPARSEPRTHLLTKRWSNEPVPVSVAHSTGRKVSAPHTPVRSLRRERFTNF